MDLTLENLDYYTGTENYYFDPFFGKQINYTDGVKYVRDNGYSYLISDVLVICKDLIRKSKIKKGDFIYIDFKKISNKWTFIIEKEDDENNKIPLYKQSYDFSDSEKELKFYFLDSCDDIKLLLLANEY